MPTVSGRINPPSDWKSVTLDSDLGRTTAAVCCSAPGFIKPRRTKDTGPSTDEIYLAAGVPFPLQAVRFDTPVGAACTGLVALYNYGKQI